MQMIFDLCSHSSADFDKRGAELEEHGVKSEHNGSVPFVIYRIPGVGAVGHNPRHDTIDRCNFQVRPYTVGKCP